MDVIRYVVSFRHIGDRSGQVQLGVFISEGNARRVAHDLEFLGCEVFGITAELNAEPSPAFMGSNAFWGEDEGFNVDDCAWGVPY